MAKSGYYDLSSNQATLESPKTTLSTGKRPKMTQNFQKIVIFWGDIDFGAKAIFGPKNGLAHKNSQKHLQIGLFSHQNRLVW